MRLLPLILATLFISIATAADLELPSGRVLKNYKVIGEDPQWLMIMHSEGVDNFDFFDLPKSIREEYGYSPEKAETAKADRIAVTEARKAKTAAREIANAQISKAAVARRVAIEAEAKRKTEQRKISRTLAGSIEAKRTEGYIMNCPRPRRPTVVASSSARYGGGGGVYNPNKGKTTRPEFNKLYGTFLVTDIPDDALTADSGSIAITAIPSGRYQYTDDYGTYHAMQKYKYVGPIEMVKN